jgi:hypothetical protein
MAPAVVTPWLEPIAHWLAPVDSFARHAELRASGELVSHWPRVPLEPAGTDCFRVGADYWIWQPGFGGIRFHTGEPAFFAYPAREIGLPHFAFIVTRSWMPAVYPLWGRQVLHASAVARVESGRVVAFVGSTRAGKSTLAFGLAQRPGWRQVADDTLGFSHDHGRLSLHPVPNEIRLRPATAAHFGRPDGPDEPLDWPARPLTLDRLYFVQGNPDQHEAVERAPLTAAASYLRLLEQAHAFSMALPEHNQRLMRDYLALATQVPAARLAYRRSFDALDAVFDAVESTS